jgi:hypothetical protein
LSSNVEELFSPFVADAEDKNKRTMKRQKVLLETPVTNVECKLLKGFKMYTEFISAGKILMKKSLVEYFR